MGNYLGFNLNFLMILFGTIDEDEASSCTSESFRKDGMYVGYNDMGHDGINGSEESGNGSHEDEFSTSEITLILSTGIR